MADEKKHPIQGVMETAMQSIKEMVDVNTIVGDPITTPDGSTIIPVSKVSFGFASGGSDFTTKKHTEAPGQPFCFGGGSGAGINISPIAFLVVTSQGSVSMLPINQPSYSAVDKIVERMPDIMDKVKGFIDKKKDEKDSEKED